MNITAKSAELFADIAREAVNWDGTPWVGELCLSAAERGNLSDLVQKGLITVEQYAPGETYIKFTATGTERAGEVLGQDVSHWCF